MFDLNDLGKRAKAAASVMNKLGVAQKNKGLSAAANALVDSTDYILLENEKDMKAGIQKGMATGLLDRLKLTPERIEEMAEGLRQIVALEDPVGEVLSMKTRPNGLVIGQKRVPLGVIGIIYESYTMDCHE